jgi:DNA-binding transcriptional ArsR family regulator
MPEPPTEPLSDAELRALGHPLRVRMLESLAADGPATATQLAERFQENSGATSYHLRQLAEHGFIEEDTARSGGRQRWWKVCRRGWHLAVESTTADSTRRHAAVLLHEINRSRLERLRSWFENFAQWDEHWRAAATESDARLELTRDELAALTDQLDAVLARFVQLQQEREPPPGAARVDVQLYAYPVRLHEPPEGQGP